MSRDVTFQLLWSDFRKTERRALRAFRIELDLIGRQLNTTAMVFDEIPIHFVGRKELIEIWEFHIAKLLTSFEGALSNSLRGLFSESANLIRVGLETAWQLLYLHDKSEKRQRWMDNQRITTAAVREHLNVSDVRREIYDAFCEVSHPRRKGMEWYFTYRKGSVRYGPTFEPVYVRNHLHRTSQFLGWIQEDIISRLYPNAFGNSLIEPVPALISAYLDNRGQYNELFSMNDPSE